MTPTIGRTVHYRLSDTDVAQILQAYGNPPTGMNMPIVGDTYPAVIVRVFGALVNLQVLLDGPVSAWATSRAEGDAPGTWAWPARV